MLKKSIKKITRFRPRVRSRHSTHDVLRNNLPLFPFRSVIRLGSTSEVTGVDVQVNTVDAVRTSANKLLMKQAFTNAGVQTADWWTTDGQGVFFQNNTASVKTVNGGLPYPIVAKHIYGSRGTGNTLIHTEEELETWLQGKTLSNYIFEKFYNYSREYRLHVTTEGCFYTCRKMLKTEATDRWFRNDSNSIWVLEDNPLFDKPVNWDLIVQDCVTALNAVGLDFGAMDVRVQSRLNGDGEERESPKWIILESNSAPSFGDLTTQKYLEELPKILMKKWNLRSIAD
jgi:D-alanine-D-alanine ligase-like ATP-grasp enzyme